MAGGAVFLWVEVCWIFEHAACFWACFGFWVACTAIKTSLQSSFPRGRVFSMNNTAFKVLDDGKFHM